MVVVSSLGAFNIDPAHSEAKSPTQLPIKSESDELVRESLAQQRKGHHRKPHIFGRNR
jgi:hypothetical protein